MSSNDSVNKAIVRKTQEILKEMGCEIKLAQVYELLSKLSNEKNWNTAKARNVSFEETLNNLNFNSLEIYYRVLFMAEGWKNKDLLFNFLSNNPNTLNFILTSKIKASVLENISLPKLLILNNSAEGLTRVTELLIQEHEGRKELFKKHGVSNIVEYEKKTSSFLTRCHIQIEEFHQPSMTELNFETNHVVAGTVAAKFKELLRTGRAYGITIIMAPSERGNSIMENTPTADTPTQYSENDLEKLIQKLVQNAELKLVKINKELIQSFF